MKKSIGYFLYIIPFHKTTYLGRVTVSRASHSYFVDTVYSEMLRYSIDNVYAYAANPGFISDIKDRIGENL